MQSIKMNLLVSCDACDLECKSESVHLVPANLDTIALQELHALMKEGDIHPCGQKMLCAGCYGAFESWTEDHKAEHIEAAAIMASRIRKAIACECLPPKHTKPNGDCYKCNRPFPPEEDAL